METKKERQRRISLEDDFMNHTTNDILYTYMLVNSTYHPIEKRFYMTLTNYKLKNISNTIGKLLGKQKRTIDNHLEKMINKGLIAIDRVRSGNNEVDAYVFPYDENGLYKLVNNDILEYIVNTRNVCGVRIYVYLLNKHLWKQGYEFTSKELLTAIGFSKNTEQVSLYKMINDILDSLTREGIIKYTDEYKDMLDNRGVLIKTPIKKLWFVAQSKSEL